MLFAMSLAALAVALVPAATATTSKTVAVSITKTAFVPKALTVNVGDTVTWTNKDTQNQQVQCAKCPFTSSVLAPNHSYSYKFIKIGKFAITDPLHTRIKGTVTVKASTATSVTLGAKPKVVKYLTQTTLSGQVSSGKAHESVVILGRDCNQTLFSTVTTVSTGSHGRFTLPLTMKENTVYQARWTTAKSTEVSVRVRPRIRLAKIAPHKFRVRVKAAESFAGKTVIFQKQTAAGGWRKVKIVGLHFLTTTSTGTVISGRTFKSKIRRGRMVRILMRSSQTLPCYLGNHSNVITS